MNDLAILLQQVNDMNASWLQIAVTAQSAFDTIDAAALKTQQILKDTVADVEGLSKSLVGVNSEALNLNIDKIQISNRAIQALNRQITQRIDIAGSKPASDTSTINFESGTENEDINALSKIAKGALKGVTKTGVQSLIKRTPLKKFLSEDVLKRSTRSLLKSNLLEEAASSASEVVGDGIGAMLGDFGFGEALSGIAGFGVEASMLAFAPEVALAIGGAYALTKLFTGSKSHKPTALPSVPSYDDPFQEVAKESKRVVTKRHKKNESMIGTLPAPPPEVKPVFKPNMDLIPKRIVGVADNTINHQEIRDKSILHVQALRSKEQEERLKQQSEEHQSYQIIEVRGNAASGSNGGKVINININRAFIENFSIHAQNIQQGYDGLKQKVEEIFLEILNSANAIHE